MSKSSSNGNGGCFSGIARLVLCKRGLQTHPSDETPIQFHHKHSPNLKIEPPITTTTTPGVVAKLMGLDSLPASNWVPNTPDLVTRSRSVNFMDYLLEFDLGQPQNQQHRRVKSSVSFREVPSVLAHENQHDFFVLYLENVEKDKKLRKSEVGFEDMKQKKVEKSKNQRNQETRKFGCNNKKVSRFGSCRGGEVKSGFVSPLKRTVKKSRNRVKPINQKEVLVESKFMKKIKNQNANKQDSTPISVHQEIPLSGKKRSPKSTNLNKREMKSDYIEQKRTEVRNDFGEVIEKLCKLTEEDIKECNWVGDFESSEEICLYLEQQILEQMVEELLDARCQ